MGTSSRRLRQMRTPEYSRYPSEARKIHNDFTMFYNALVHVLLHRFYTDVPYPEYPRITKHSLSLSLLQIERPPNYSLHTLLLCLSYEPYDSCDSEDSMMSLQEFCSQLSSPDICGLTISTNQAGVCGLETHSSRVQPAVANPHGFS